ncbi:MAG: phytanoyl-CoA dioxygenase family protein [Gammaproteobacteria bacterium]|nr:phytanoyl-CoA dioxygenase family protein [Gammaproteobacteria bacterium]
MPVLTNEQINFFTDNGYLVVPGFYTGDELTDLKKWTDEVLNYPEIPGKHMMYFEESLQDSGKRILCRMENIEPFHEGFSEVFQRGKLRDAVSDLFAEEAVLYKDKINFKLAGGDGFKAHQDVQAGWGKYASIHITAMVSIDDTTLENGCLEMAGGHHHSGVIGDIWKPLNEDELEYVPVETRGGDAVFFDSYAPHRSKPNLTSEPRRILYVTYNKLSEGDSRQQYYDDKRKSYPPDCEREPDREYVFRV